MTLRERVARFFGLQVPPPPCVTSLRWYSEELSAAATDLRAIALRAVVLEQRASELGDEFEAWQRRLERAQYHPDPGVPVVAARIVGRVEGQLQVTRRELAVCLEEEIALRTTLIDRRRHWLRLIEENQALGLNVSSALLHIDLSRPEPPAPEPNDDPEREFVARLIDGAPVH